jgi:hypothetical protein
MGGKTVGWVTPDREGFIPLEGLRTSGGSRTTKKIENVVADHEPVTAPMEYGPSATGQAAFEGGVLILQGINYLLSKINGPIQQRRFQEAWDRKKDAVFKRLNEDPQLGAMIYIYYSRPPLSTAGSDFRTFRLPMASRRMRRCGPTGRKIP